MPWHFWQIIPEYCLSWYMLASSDFLVNSWFLVWWKVFTYMWIFVPCVRRLSILLDSSVLASSHLSRYKTHFSAHCCLWLQTLRVFVLVFSLLRICGPPQAHTGFSCAIWGHRSVFFGAKLKNHWIGCRVSAQNRRGWFLAGEVVIGLPHWCLVWCCLWESFMSWVKNELNWCVFFNKIKDW